MKRLLVLFVVIISLIFVSCGPNTVLIVGKVDGPESTINDNYALFKWTGSDSTGVISTYQYRKDSGNWMDCNETQYQWSAIDEGEHSFDIRAKGEKDGEFSNIITWDFEYDLITHTVTLQDIESFGFYTHEKNSGASGGDFYYRTFNGSGQNKFLANNTGQSGIIDMGVIPFSASINPPASGYSIFSVEAFLSHVYISEASSGDYKHVIFKVIGLTNDSITIEYFPTIK